MNIWLKNKFSKNFVEKDMKNRINENAIKMWLSLNEYYKIRKLRKNKTKENNESIVKNKGIHIEEVYSFNKIKWWLLILSKEKKNEKITIKAFINEIGTKPQILCDYSKLTYVEKNKAKKIIYGYFNSLK